MSQSWEVLVSYGPHVGLYTLDGGLSETFAKRMAQGEFAKEVGVCFWRVRVEAIERQPP